MTVIEARKYLDKIDAEGKGLEPVFILRGQDSLAHNSIIDWAQRAEKHGVDPEKLTGAWVVVQSFLKWPHKKMPD